MYTIFQNVINQGNFDLNSLVAKVSKYHIEGLLSDEERDNLLASARSYADPSYSFDKWQVEVSQLWNAVRELQAQVAALQAEVPVDPEVPVEPEPEVDEWPDYVQPTGAHNAYPLGAKVTYNNQHYISLIADNIWTPIAYPDGWQLQE